MKKHQKTPFVRAMLALLVLLLFSDSVWASGYCPVHPSQNYVPPMIGYAPRPGPDHPAGPDPDYSSSSRSNNRSSSSTSMSNITYYVDGSINTSLTPKTYNKSSGATLPTPTKAGYIFSGWYSSSNYGGTIFTSISSGCNDDVTLYGKFYANTYTVQFNANDGTNRTETQTFTYDQSQNLTENPFSASTGYGNFIKWTTQSNGTGTSYTNGQNVLNLTATIDGVVNLYAQWTKDIATNSQIHFAVSDQEYTGEEIKPAVTVRDNNTDITEYFTYTYTDNVNAGTATVTISNSTSPLYSGTKTLNFKITKATAKIVNEPLPKTLTYNGNEQELITAGSANSGPVLYSLDDVNYSEEIPTAVKADDYTVYYKVEETENYKSLQGSLKVTIEKATPTVTPPEGKKIAYKSSEKNELVTAGSANSGALLYSLDGKTFSENIPVATDVGNYNIYYKVEENENFVEVSGSVQSCIKYIPTVGREKPRIIYNGKEQKLIERIWTNYGTLLFSLDGENYSEEIPTAVNAGEYTVYFKIEEGEDYLASAYSFKSQILKAEQTIEKAPEALENLIYTGKAQELISAGSSTFGPMLYSLDGENYSEAIPTAVNANEYTVYYKVEEVENYKSLQGSLKVKIEKATPTVTRPKGKKIRYNGNAQELITAGSANSVAMLYSLDGKKFREAIPTAKEIGYYTIYYKVIETSNFVEVSGSVKSCIKYRPSVQYHIAESIIYNGEEQPLIEEITTDYGTLLFSLDGGNISTEIPTAINAGEYTILIKIEEGETYLGVSQKFRSTIKKAKPTVTAPVANELIYDGNAQKLIMAGSANSGTLLYSLDGENYSEEIPTGLKAGTYTVYYKVEETENYNSLQGSLLAKINKATLTITAKNKTIDYGDEPANDGVEYAGFAGEENASVLGGTLTYGYNYKKGNKTGEYTITPSGLTSDNYAISFVSGMLTVETKKTTFAAAQVSEDEKGKRVEIDGDYDGTEEFKITEDIKDVAVTFNRKFTPNRGFATIMLPFDVKASSLTGVKSIIEFAGVFDNNGKKAVGMRYVWCDADLGKEELKNKRKNCNEFSGNLTAYTPYMVEMKSTTLEVVGGVTLKSNSGKSVGDARVGDWVFRGSLQYKYWLGDEKIIEKGRLWAFTAAANNGSTIGQFKRFGGNNWVNPFRAYLADCSDGFDCEEYFENPSPKASLVARYRFADALAPTNSADNSSSAKTSASAAANQPLLMKQSADSETASLEGMEIVIVDGDKDSVGGKEHTTVIGRMNPATGEIRMLPRTTQTYDLKGRRVNSEKRNARGAYYNRR